MRRVAIALAGLALAGCASMQPRPRPVVPVDPIAAAEAQRRRADDLGLAGGDCAAPAWGMAGRVAVSVGKEGGSGRIEWIQGGGRVELVLSAPVTRQGWVLEMGPEGAILRGVAGGPREGADPARLLREATGWDIPVAALGCWLRGVEADPARFGPARLEQDATLLPLRLEQAGWSVDYLAWRDDARAGVPLPARIVARRGDSQVRLVVDSWGQE